MKQCLTVYYSYHHGNTEKVANAMAKISNAETCTIDQLPEQDLEKYDIIGFGSGIAYGRHYDKFLNAVSSLSLHGKNVFVFSTSGIGAVKFNTALIDLLKGAGASVVGSFACKGFDTFGPFKLMGGIAKGHPNNEDMAAAQKFVESVTL